MTHVACPFPVLHFNMPCSQQYPVYQLCSPADHLLQNLSGTSLRKVDGLHVRTVTHFMMVISGIQREVYGSSLSASNFIQWTAKELLSDNHWVDVKPR